MSIANQINQSSKSPQTLLDAAYELLDYQSGDLQDAISSPSVNTEDWIEKGDWLKLAADISAEKILFVRNEPLIVFRRYQTAHEESELLDVFRQVWCMYRPQRLFVSLPGELRVYGLNRAPARNITEWNEIQPLKIIRDAAEILDMRSDYSRQVLEAGRLPQDDSFGDPEQRADRRLLSDLRSVQRALVSKGLKPRYAHALIGRSIFIRYLEDREILTDEYFAKVASKNAEWNAQLSQVIEKPVMSSSRNKLLYSQVLRSKDFTYEFFRQLARDFNGDMFPRDSAEEENVQPQHLDLLRKFLFSDVQDQSSLFFWAYDFKIIPIDLISSIYEEFYHTEYESDDKGTHYTPSALVEYIVSQILPIDELESNPRVLDPACGSGIFLVEAFRRIVRYRTAISVNRQLSAKELRSILRDQIAGIEINQEAIHVAAFSLYLALLNYQQPPDILSQIGSAQDGGKPLPYLIYEIGTSLDDDHYQVLFNANAFGLTYNEKLELIQRLGMGKFPGRAEVQRLYESSFELPLNLQSFDVIIGNPPWGYKQGDDALIRQTQEHALRWCKVFQWSIGDNEMSQAFIARSLSLLRPDGVCGLLVSTGIFFKDEAKSEKFRQRLLDEATLIRVLNFAHVRDAFFSSAIAPFALVELKAQVPEKDHQVQYWSAKQTRSAANSPIVVLNNSDLKRISQQELKNNSLLWKTYWWGNHRDAGLVYALGANSRLIDLIKKRDWSFGQGYKRYNAKGPNSPSGWLRQYKELPTDKFHSYGAIDNALLVSVPDHVHQHGKRQLYGGSRLLVVRGISQKMVRTGD